MKSILKEKSIFTHVHYLEKHSHIFFGPYKKEDGDSCFQCFYQALDSNDSDLKAMIDYGPNFITVNEKFIDFFEAMESELFINSVLIFNKKTYEYEWKKIRKTPFCEKCKNYIEQLPKHKWEISNNHFFREKSMKEIDRIIKKFEDDIIDWDVGIGKIIFRDAESNIIPMYAIEANMNKRTFFSYGRTVSLKDSKNAAYLEFLERHSSMVPQFKEAIYASYNNHIDKGNKVIPPEKYILGRQQNFDRNKKMYWTNCIEFNSGEQFLIPEQMMYFDNQQLRKEERFIYETSNGTALGGSPEEALVYAVLEAIERDSFLVYWYTKKRPKKVDISSIKSEKVKYLLMTFDQLGYDMFIFDITLETEIPTVWVLMRNRNDNANLFLYNAAGAHFDPESAIFAALVEVGTAIIVYEEKLHEDKENLRYLIGQPEEVVKMDDHVNYYAFKENAGAFDYILKHIEELEMIKTEKMKPDFSFSHKNILDKVSAFHNEIYYTDMSNKLLHDMGLAVVKVFIPSFQPMTFGKQNERLNKARLESIAGNGKLDIGKEPHPFP